MPNLADQSLTQALRECGYRVTAPRLAVFRALCELDRHSTADEVQDTVRESLPAVSLPTVYASLDLLAELGLARRITGTGSAIRFDPRVDDHHHLVCRSCGRVEDLDAEVDAEPAMRAAGRRGFSPDRSELTVTGLCAGCAGTG